MFSNKIADPAHKTAAESAAAAPAKLINVPLLRIINNQALYNSSFGGDDQKRFRFKTFGMKGTGNQFIYIAYIGERREMMNKKQKKSKWLYTFLSLLLAVFVIGACTAGPNTLVNVPDEDGEVAGFWMGLWHGFISPFTFIISLFRDNIQVFDVHNNGNWYVFGFLMGASVILGGGSGGAVARKCR
jgi:hypothetical protein